MLVVFDDKEEFRTVYEQAFPKMGIKMDVCSCETKERIREILADKQTMEKAKVLIFDLSTTSVEAETLQFDILEDINTSYKHFSIPIVIHSAFADKIDSKYDNLGTLFKVKKSDKSVQEILEKILLFYESGFLDIFSPKGSLELELFKEIHKAFNEQFLGKEIEEIILSIKHANPAELRDRVKNVFERIAIRSLYQNLLSAKKQTESNQIDEIKINAVEHYYRRKSDFEVWTGDIFENVDDKKQIIILTPRCDINNGSFNNQFLACTIEKLNPQIIKEMASKEALQKYITDNPNKAGIKNRFLVPAPNYSGGKVILSNYFFVHQNDFSEEARKYKYIISLSDELTNEIVRKFSGYIQRGGISASDIDEATFYSLSALKEQ